MSSTAVSPALSCAQGVSEAVARYGAPVELTITLPVGDELFAYWQLVLSNRDAEVVLAAQRPSGRFLIHTKGEYPDGVYRLMSGGIGRDEDVLQAVHRELVEETGLDGQIARFVGILTTRFQHEGQELGFVSYLFHIRLSDGPLSPEDDAEDIIGFREVTLQELGELADELECLDNGFWRDWGRFRGAAHRLLVEELTA